MQLEINGLQKSLKELSSEVKIRCLFGLYLFYFGDDQLFVNWLEQLRSTVGAFIGLALMLLIARTLEEFAEIGGAPCLVESERLVGNCWQDTFVAIGISAVYLINSPLLAMPCPLQFSYQSLVCIFCAACIHWRQPLK